MQFYTLRAWRSALSVLAILLACATIAVPQNTSEAHEEKPEADASVGTFKVSVDVVNIFFNVKDKHGLLIPNLTKNDFDVFEDGRPQTIKYFAAEANQPLTLGLLIDTSVSQERVLPMEKEVGAAFL